MVLWITNIFIGDLIPFNFITARIWRGGSNRWRKRRWLRWRGRRLHRRISRACELSTSSLSIGHLTYSFLTHISLNSYHKTNTLVCLASNSTLIALVHNWLILMIFLVLNSIRCLVLRKYLYSESVVRLLR